MRVWHYWTYSNRIVWTHSNLSLPLLSLVARTCGDRRWLYHGAESRILIPRPNPLLVWAHSGNALISNAIRDDAKHELVSKKDSKWPSGLILQSNISIHLSQYINAKCGTKCLEVLLAPYKSEVRWGILIAFDMQHTTQNLWSAKEHTCFCRWMNFAYSFED